MDTDVNTFVSSHNHWLQKQQGYEFPRLLRANIHAKKLNEVIHLDYCSIGKGENWNIYFLFIKDDISGYVWLLLCKEYIT